MNPIIDFLRRLAANNNRDWFNAHKEEYLAVKARVDSLTEQLIAAVATVDPDATALRVQDCTYRIYRDTRFSPDKTPYKTHIGIFVNPPHGKKSLRCGYYLHLEPDAAFFAAGTVCLPSPVVKAIRTDIYDNIDEYISIVEDPEFTRYFTKVGENPVATAPKGFPRDWPYIAYIRPRDFVASSLLKPSDLDDRLIELLMPRIAQAKRFNDFINYSIDRTQSTD